MGDTVARPDDALAATILHHSGLTRQAFVHEAFLAMEPEVDERAPQGRQTSPRKCLVRKPWQV
jgi:hypothetical protein